MTSDTSSGAGPGLPPVAQVIEALPRAIVITDLDGAVLAWNGAAEEMFGVDREMVLGRSVACAIEVLAGPALVAEMQERVVAGDTWRGDLQVRGRDATPRRIWAHVAPLRDESAQVVGIVAASDDVTDQRVLEQRAADLTDHLLLALSAGELGTWRWDAATGVTTWDATMERLFGLPEGSFDGTFDAWVELLHPDDRDQALAVVEAAVAERSAYVLDHRVMMPDGSCRWIQGRGKVTLDAEGTVTGTIGCAADITARKQAELAAEQRAAEAARAMQVERRQRERIEFLAGISDAALAAADHRAFMAAVVRSAVPALGDWCAIHFAPEPGQVPERAVGHADRRKLAWLEEMSERYPYDPDAPFGVPAVIRSGSTEFFSELDDELLTDLVGRSNVEHPDQLLEVLRALDLTSSITVPLRSKRGVIGAMQFVTAESGLGYTDSDVALALATAGRVADILEYQWLTEQHHHIAVTLQGALLPPKLPVIPGVDLAVGYWAAGAASEVGGDFYDAFQLDANRWAVVIGDVCGTGPDAAALLGMARHTMRAAARHGADHAEVLEWLNEALGASNRDLFATTIFSTLERDDAGWRLVSVSGGHPLPVVVRAGGASETVGAPGTLLGMFPDVTTRPGEVRLAEGDTVVLYTDGVTDLPPPHGLDAAQVQAFVAEAASGADDATAVVDAIGAALEARLPLVSRDDDIAIVVLRVEDAG